MAEQQYEVRVRVPLSKVALVIETLEGEGVLLGVHQIEVDAPAKKGKRASVSYYHAPGTERGIDLAGKVVDEVKPGGLITLAAMAAAFKKAGRSPKSASPIMTALVRTGRLATTEKLGVFTRVK